MSLKLARMKAAQSAAKEAEQRYARVTAACNAVSARIDAHGADGLGAFCAAYLGSGETMGTAILGLVLRRLGRDARDEVREVLCL
jgi:hypothetical protein